MKLNFATHAHQYQRSGAAHLWNSVAHNGVATLWLDPGYGKTMIVLHAFKALLDAGMAKTMLVVAPLRVAQTVWAQEIEEWASLKGLVACRLHGPKKDKQLDRRDVNIWIINYEGIPWFIKQAKAGKIAPLDVICFDEIRRMKNSQGKRFKAARPLTKMAKYKWGLTGTPASNGLMDLFGQFLILDDGEALGKYITKYRMNYFEQGYDGFTYIPRPGAQDLIEARIKDYIYRADGFLDLPTEVPDPRKIVLPDAAMKKYKQLKKDMLLELQAEGEKITAANAAVLVGKLKQIANGRVYDEDRNIIHVHEAKKEALAELRDELGDEQLLIAYEYNHDLDQLREALGDDLPYLGAGVNEKTALDYVDRWNKGEIKVLAAHPASAGHGLNLQKSGAHHILWWGPTVDLDHYIQFIRRLLRQGSVASHVVIHTFVAVGTVDESVIVAREDKDGLQTGLLSALTAEFGAAMVADVGHETQTEDTSMSELAFKNDAQQAANPFAQAAQAQPAAPAANPFGGAPGTTPAPTAAPAAPQQNPTNPFGGGAPAAPTAETVQQQAAIQAEVAAPAMPTPDPASAPPNPFTQPAAAPAPQAPVQEAVVVQETAPVTPPEGVVTPAPATAQEVIPATPDAPFEGVAPAAEPVPNHTEVAVDAGHTGVYVPVNVVVPADKLDKVLAAIGRAVKP